MKLVFLGAARCVTGSCHLIDSTHGKVIVDCGMQQGADAKGDVDEVGFDFDASSISALLLTHAHIDHSGLIPLLVKKGFTGKIICTGATAQLCGIMLPDSGHIQEQDAQWQNRKRERQGKDPIEPMYTAEDAKNALKYFQPCDYDEIVEVLPGITALFRDAGHMLGSAEIEVWVKEDGKKTKMLFSGDLGHADKPIIKDPMKASEADYVIMEGTYGNRLHKPFVDGSDEFIGIIKTTFARGGNVVIPAFAVGRTQELLYLLHKLFREKKLDGKIPVYIDSPLGIEATKVFESVSDKYFDDETMAMISAGEDPLGFPSLRIASTSDESKLINEEQGSKIIISSSGMCEAGRIRHHLKHNLWRPESTILFSGFQAIGTLGRSLLDGVKSVKLMGETISVNARIENLEGFSGHADKNELIGWLSSMKAKPQKVFLVHGENAVLEEFGAELEKLGQNVSIPYSEQVFELVGREIADYETEADRLAQEPVYGGKKSFELPIGDKLYNEASRITQLLTSAQSKDGIVQRILVEDLKTFADKWEKLLK